MSKAAHKDKDEEAAVTQDDWKADVKCPSCGRSPDARFSEHQVRRCKVDRQRARVAEVTCTRQSCRARYWIHAGDIARAKRVRVKVDRERSAA